MAHRCATDILEIDVGERLSAGAADDEALGQLLDRPGWREAARCRHCSLASSADSTARPNSVTMSRKPSRSIRPLRISRDRVLAPSPGALVPVARQNNVMRSAASSSAAASYSITSSASASSEGGTVRPSMQAVSACLIEREGLRLIVTELGRAVLSALLASEQ